MKTALHRRPSITLRIRLPLVAAAFALAAVSTQASESLPANLQAANADLQSGKADNALARLAQALKADPSSATANNLLCRVEFGLERFDQAATDCEKAVKADPENARDHLWLGRTLGERASRASFLSAFSIAKRTREEFETAVRLDPRDVEALSDLGEFYTDAPGVIGGGTDKAQEIASRLMPLDPSRAHHLLAQIAEHDKNFDTAEKELKAACTGSRTASGWMSLANFYRRRERWADLDSAIKSGQAAVSKEKTDVVALFDGAQVLIRANRDQQTAIKFLETYIASPYKSEEAPAFAALTRLAKLRKSLGDQAGAERDRAAALALAHDYKPALDALKEDKGK